METIVTELSWPVNLELPTEFRLFAAGENKSTKGSWVFDQTSAASVIEDWTNSGSKRIAIDYEHKMLSPLASPDEQKAAGWFSLALRNGELWAVDVSWTPTASAELVNRERLYVSPAFSWDKENRRVTRLINAALTNMPALYDAEQLVAASAVPFQAAKPVEEGAWDGRQAESRIRAWATKADGEIDFPKYAKGFAWYQSDRPDLLGSYKLPHHDVVDGELVTVRSGVIAAGNAISGARGGVDIPSNELAAVKNHLARHYEQFNSSAPWARERREQMSGSESDSTLAPAENIRGPVQPVVTSFESEVITMTGRATADEARGVILAWRASVDKVATLESELAAMRNAESDRLRKEEQALRDGLMSRLAKKLPPVQCEKYRDAHIATLTALVDTLPDEIAKAPPSEPVVEVLTAEERKIAAQFGISDEQYAVSKRNLSEEVGQ